MSDADADPDVTELLADLTRSLRELQSEMEPERRLRPPTPGELSQFASEVAIPGLILLLQTNIRALQLLQRTIRLAQGRDPRGGGSAGSDVRERAEELSRATLGQLDNTLSEIQDAVEGRPEDDDTRQLLSEARDLRDEIRAELDDGNGAAEDSPAANDDGTAGDTGGAAAGDSDPVDIDVEAELRTIKDNLEDDGDGEEAGDGESDDATDHGEPTGAGADGADDSTGGGANGSDGSTGDDDGDSTDPDDAAGTDGRPDSSDDG